MRYLPLFILLAVFVHNCSNNGGQMQDANKSTSTSSSEEEAPLNGGTAVDNGTPNKTAQEKLSTNTGESNAAAIASAPIPKVAVARRDTVTLKAPKLESAPASVPQTTNPWPSHAAWNEQLQRYVSSAGKVNYASWKSNKAALEGYLDSLAAHHPSSSWPRKQQMAYWINAYNAFTVKLILDNYPLTSIRDLHGGNPWDVKWIKLGDNTYSLNHIENKILRPQFGDARIHFAVNCAAKSCPPLLNAAFEAATLEQQMESQTRKFINQSAFNQFSADGASVSKIFEWYASDFGALKAFLNKYIDPDLEDGTPIRYNDYDWALNGN